MALGHEQAAPIKSCQQEAGKVVFPNKLFTPKFPPRASKSKSSQSDPNFLPLLVSYPINLLPSDR